MDVLDPNYDLYDEDRIQPFIRDRTNPVEEFSHDAFVKRFRLSKELFLDLLSQMSGLERATKRSNPLPPSLQLAVTLQFYATGSYQHVVGDMRGIS